MNNKYSKDQEPQADRAIELMIEKMKKMVNQSPTAAVRSIYDLGTEKLISDAFDKVGKEGVIIVEEAQGVENYLDWTNGMQFDRGYRSYHFITNSERMEAVLENAYILLSEKNIRSRKEILEILPLLEAIARAQEPLLIIAANVEGDALATLVINQQRGIIKVCAVKAPGFGDRQKAILKDLAILTGSTMIYQDQEMKSENITLDKLGKAKRAIITKDNTTIVDGMGKKEEISDRISHIKARIQETTSDYDREKLQERFAKLVGGVSVIRVGTGAEKARIEEALKTIKGKIDTVSAYNYDEFSKNIVGEAIDKAGKEGIVTITESLDVEGGLLVVEGMRFESNILSNHSMNDKNPTETVLENPYILLHEKTINSYSEMLPILEKVASSYGGGGTFLVIYGQIEGEALYPPFKNQRYHDLGDLHVCAVGVSGSREEVRGILEDLAVVTGGRVVGEELGLNIKNVQLQDIGKAKRIVVDRINTTIIDGLGKKEEIRSRMDQIRKRIQETNLIVNKEKLEQRLSKLVCGVVVIEVGAASEKEMKEKKAWVEKALSAATLRP